MRNVLFSAGLVVLSASAFAQTFDKQAHRGGAGLVPENTVISAKNAIDYGATIEMDLYISKDSQLVVTHDPHIVSLYASYADGRPVLKEDEEKLRIDQLDYNDIRSFEIGLRNHSRYPQQKKVEAHIPRFADDIDAAEAYAKSKKVKAPTYNIQAGPAYTITDAYRTFFVREMMDIILEKKISERSMFQAFDYGMLETVHRDYRDKIRVSYLVDVKDNFEQSMKRLSFVPDIYSPIHTNVTKEVVDKCHAMSMKIIPWTVNEKADIERLKSWGVDGIITDYPNLL